MALVLPSQHSSSSATAGPSRLSPLSFPSKALASGSGTGASSLGSVANGTAGSGMGGASGIESAESNGAGGSEGKGKGVATPGGGTSAAALNEANAIIPGVHGIVPTLQ